MNSSCKLECQKKKLPLTKLNIFAAYLQRIKKNIHVCLAMSPIGQFLGERPSLQYNLLLLAVNALVLRSVCLIFT